MKIEKIIENLKARATSTTFANEREICLKKLELYKSKAKDIGIAISNSSNENIAIGDAYDIQAMRKIFWEQFFACFADDVVIDKEHVPFDFYWYTTEQIDKKARTTLNDFPDNRKLAKYYNELINWAREEEWKLRHSVLSIEELYWYNFKFLDLQIVFWLEPDYYYTICDKDINDTYNEYVDRYKKMKAEFFEKLNNGYFDSTIRRVFDPTMIGFDGE